MAKFNVFSGLALGALMAVGSLASAGEANAGHRHGNGDALIAGVAGLLLGAAIAAPVPVYAQPYGTVIYVEPVPVYSQPVYTQPVYAQPVYSQPQYSGTDPYYIEPQERPLRRHAYQPQPQRKHYNQDSGPRVVTYDDSIGSGDGNYGVSYEPWSEAWLNYCSAKFRSFDARTGTYKGYDGLRHFCEVR